MLEYWAVLAPCRVRLSTIYALCSVDALPLAIFSAVSALLSVFAELHRVPELMATGAPKWARIKVPNLNFFVTNYHLLWFCGLVQKQDENSSVTKAIFYAFLLFFRWTFSQDSFHSGYRWHLSAG